MKKHKITAEEFEQVNVLSKLNRDKDVERRLRVIIMRYQGLKDREIAEKVGITHNYVSELCKMFKQMGAEKFAQRKYTSHNHAMSKEEEAQILEVFRDRAERGEVVCAQEIKKVFDERRGKDTGRGYIYGVLKRHGWRRIMPRSRHPKAASPEAVEDAKKLTPDIKNSWSYPPQI